MLLRRSFLQASCAAAAARLLPGIEPSRIRLGVTSDEIDEDPIVASKFLNEFGLQYAEIRNVWGKYNTAQPVEKIKELRSILDQHKLRTSILGTAFFKIPLPGDDAAGRSVLDNQWALLDIAFERAKILGTDKIRVFAFTYKDGAKPDMSLYPKIYDLVKEASRRAKARGFRLALENVGSSYVSTGAESAEILKAVKDDNFGLTWDPNNAAASGENAFPEGYKKLDPARIFHVHLRDFKHVNGKVEWTAVGDGEMDNVTQIRSLLKTGYKETFTLETHYRSPQGKAHASRTSLTGLLKVVEKV